LDPTIVRLATAPQRRARSRVYVGFALLVLASALIGFFTTFIRPMWRGEFHGPWLAHVHGALLGLCLLVFLAQAWLVRARRVATHRALG
jgi:L-lactate permease